MRRAVYLSIIPLIAIGVRAAGAQPQPPDDPADPYADEKKTSPPAARPAPLTSEQPDRTQLPLQLKRKDFFLPVMFNADTGYLLPAGVIMGNVGVDTGGGVSGSVRVGLGDVAEFGVGTTDLIRVRPCAGCDLESVRPYPYALFKMGLAEDRLFRNQPALALGFRKSFERQHDQRESRVAELYLVGSKSLGKNARLHAGAVFWDASINRPATGDEVLLHDQGLKKQLRPFGGIELQPLPRSQIMLELIWEPELRLTDPPGTDSIKLQPTFAWGVRYQLADWARFESGVRVPNIKDVNLLDAQIFGQLRFVSRRFSHFLDSLEK
jgi:hypothetical protein